VSWKRKICGCVEAGVGVAWEPVRVAWGRGRGDEGVGDAARGAERGTEGGEDAAARE
jgi:hypothetical protein